MNSDSGNSFELSSNGGDTGDSVDVATDSLTRSQALNLYVSHAFSTWNARGYEFATILFTAAAYPDTLVAAALRMIIVYFAMILFSTSVGHWVQNSPDRLRTLLSTIICNRGSVILGSFFWILILSQEDLVGREGIFVLPKNTLLRGVGFAAAVAFGIVERLSSSGNLISMERDWVVTVAAPAGMPYDLTHLNAAMRRIDLVCKLISPILIAVVISALGSIRLGVVFSGLTSLVCIPIEVFSAKRVWNSSPSLQLPRVVPPPQPTAQPSSNSWLARAKQHSRGFELYFGTTVWVPSLALALLHFNMLTWRATFITYLINAGYSLNVITLARAIGSLFEITSTVITPRGIEYMGKAHHHARPSSMGEDDDEAEVGLIDGDHEGSRDEETLIGLQRFGLWGMSWQLVNTFPVVLALWAISAQRDEMESLLASPPRISSKQSSPSVGWSVVLFSFLAFSRLGVWVFDLTTQQLTQTLVSEYQRSSFAGTENSVVNIFELLGATSAVAFPHTEQYRWLALASLVTVVVSWIMYASWVHQQRGHLVHWEKLARGFCYNGRKW